MYKFALYLTFTIFWHSNCLPGSGTENATKDLYEETERSLKDSALLRLTIDNHVLESSSKRLRDQADAVDIALARCISDTHNVKHAIENNLKHVSN